MGVSLHLGPFAKAKPKDIVSKLYLESAQRLTRPTITLVILSYIAVLASQGPDSRARRAQGSNTKPFPTSTQTPTATSTPRAATADKVAPTLGEPPPPPRLKPTPTPAPPDELDPESVIRVNTELVTLNVRVIDRNNRPIENVRQDEFRVFEDGQPQPVEFFTTEQVPITYGLAVDTSGSLRSQLQSVIDAAKAIINSNKSADETFIERFISSDKIGDVTGLHRRQESPARWC
jgi:hypothetical protein